MSIYYLDKEIGKDSNKGTSQDHPWQSVERLNQASLCPGDQVLFKGGQTFAGTIFLNGTGKQQITLSSYGEGRATVDAGDSEGLIVNGCEHIIIRDINFHGSGRKQGNTTDGVKLLHTRGVTITNVDVTGFRGAGIMTFGDKGTCITHVYARENGFAGIAVMSGMEAITKDLYIAHCIAENNPGDPSVLDNHSGNGIVVGGVDCGIIEFCEAMRNGWDMPRGGNGPVGIWAWHSNRVIIQHCISHHNQSPGLDGGGFDFDGGMTNSIMQHNISYQNAGAGYGLYQFYGAAPWRDNIIRHNISVDDGYKNSQSGIHIWSGGSDMSCAEIYDNTIISCTGHAVSYLHDVPGLLFHDNIFITGSTPIYGPHSKSSYSGNVYWNLEGGIYYADKATNCNSR